MSNFAKDLREYTDDELYRDINELDVRYMSVLSDELTRRSADKWSQKTVYLTLLLLFIGLLQVFISLRSISRSWVEWIFLILLVTYAIIYILQLMQDKKGKIKK